MSIDPILAVTQSAFEYSGSNPVDFDDPSGYDSPKTLSEEELRLLEEGPARAKVRGKLKEYNAARQKKIQNEKFLHPDDPDRRSKQKDRKKRRGGRHQMSPAELYMSTPICDNLAMQMPAYGGQIGEGGIGSTDWGAVATYSAVIGGAVVVFNVASEVGRTLISFA